MVLLDLQHLQADSSPRNLTEISLAVWLAYVLEAFQFQIQQREQTLEIDVPPDLPSLNTEVYRLNRLIKELVTNACKHSPTGAAIAISATATPHTIQLTVQNSGVEIPPAEQANIFNPFYRIPSDDPWKEGGTGMGLALAQRLVAHLYGSLRVESAENLTRFILELPL